MKGLIKAPTKIAGFWCLKWGVHYLERYWVIRSTRDFCGGSLGIRRPYRPKLNSLGPKVSAPQAP